MKKYKVVDSFKAQTRGGGKKEIHLTTECGKTKTLTQWAKKIGVKRQVVYARYKSRPLPSLQILSPHSKILKSNLDIWNRDMEGGWNPERITEEIEVKNERGRNEVLYRCDNGFIYELISLANLKGINYTTLQGRIYQHGVTNPHLFTEIKPGCKFGGEPKARGGKKLIAGQSIGNAEWNAFKDCRRNNCFLHGNGKFDDLLMPTPPAARGGAAKYLGETV